MLKLCGAETPFGFAQDRLCPQIRVALQRLQGCYDYRQPAELRSAWTGEGARPHMCNYY